MGGSSLRTSAHLHPSTPNAGELPESSSTTLPIGKFLSFVKANPVPWTTYPSTSSSQGRFGKFMSISAPGTNFMKSLKRHDRVNDGSNCNDNGCRSCELVGQRHKSPLLCKSALAFGLIEIFLFCGYDLIGVVLGSRHFALLLKKSRASSGTLISGFPFSMCS